jgi:hypothetical protein
LFSEIPIGVEDTAATNLTLLKPVGEVTISSRVVGFQNKKVVETYQLFNFSIVQFSLLNRSGRVSLTLIWRLERKVTSSAKLVKEIPKQPSTGF